MTEPLILYCKDQALLTSKFAKIATVFMNKCLFAQLQQANSCSFCTDMITRMFKKIYSERGTSERVKEETTFMLFLDLLHECEGMHINICNYVL